MTTFGNQPASDVTFTNMGPLPAGARPIPCQHCDFGTIRLTGSFLLKCTNDDCGHALTSQDLGGRPGPGERETMIDYIPCFVTA